MTEQPWIGPHGRVMRRLELHLTYHCPERCVFCSEDHRMTAFNAFPVTYGRVATVLRQQAARGITNIHITGGEPTIHPRFIDVLKLAKKLGMRTSIGTIGTRLADKSFAQAALPWLDEALFSIHGPTAEVHDALTRRKGSFQRVTTAMRNCLELQPNFGAFVNTVVTRKNIDVLPETVGMVDAMGAQLVVISNLTPEGLGSDRYEELAVPLETLADVLPGVPERAHKAVVRFFAVPMCVLGKQSMLSNDLHWDPRVTVEWAKKPGKVVFEGVYSWAPDRKRTHVSACEGCSARSMCMGVFERYRELWSVDALQAG